MQLNKLLSPGAFIYNDRLYLVGGKIYINSCYEFSDKIFSIDLTNEKFEIIEENLTLPKKLANPACIVYNSEAIIASGFTEDNILSKVLYILNFEENSITEYEVMFESGLEESYPPIVVDNQITFFTFPRIFGLLIYEKKIMKYRIQQTNVPCKIGEIIVKNNEDKKFSNQNLNLESINNRILSDFDDESLEIKEKKRKKHRNSMEKKINSNEGRALNLIEEEKIQDIKGINKNIAKNRKKFDPNYSEIEIIASIPN